MDTYDVKLGDSVAPLPVAAAERVTTFLRAVYGWMCVGLGVTAMVAYGVAGSPEIVRTLLTNRLLFFALIGGELGLVFYLSARVDRIAPRMASALFLGYSALNGVTLSLILLAYTRETVANTFGAVS